MDTPLPGGFWPDHLSRWPVWNPPCLMPPAASSPLRVTMVSMGDGRWVRRLLAWCPACLPGFRWGWGGVCLLTALDALHGRSAQDCCVEFRRLRFHLRRSGPVGVATAVDACIHSRVTLRNYTGSPAGVRPPRGEGHNSVELRRRAGSPRDDGYQPSPLNQGGRGALLP